VGLIEKLIRRRVLTTVLVLIALILGILSYFGLNLRRFPEINFPVATVSTRYPGGNPSEIESDITKPIEDAVASISGVEKITSYSQQGRSVVMIEFGLDSDIDQKWMDVRSQVDLVLHDLPDGAENPVVLKFELSQFPVLTLAITGPQNVNELYRVADEDLSALISQAPGVADVQITGGQAREVHVLLDARKLRKYRVPIGSVVTALRMANLDLPAGHITQPGREYVIRAVGKFKSIEEIKQVRIPTQAATILTVGDLGEVRDTYEERRTSSRFGGKDAIVLSVQAQTDANEVEVVDGVLARLPELRRKLPPGATIQVAEDTSDYIRGALGNVRNNMIIGILLTAVVLYLFLKSWRATVVAAVVMPVAVVISLVGLLASGFTLNILSLTGLAIVIGVLVNNAILILENVSRLIHEGQRPTEAAINGTRDIALAVFSSTATNLVVFLPIAFMGEMIGQMFRELGLTVVYATVVSLAVSFSLTPMMCAFLLREKEDGAGPLGWLRDRTLGLVSDLWRSMFGLVRRAYLVTLDWCLRRRLATLLIALMMLAPCVWVFSKVNKEFFPRADEGQFRITVEMPAGTPLSGTNDVVRRIEQYVRRVPYLESYYSRVGHVSGFLGGSSEGVNLAEVMVTVSDKSERPYTVDNLMNDLRPKLAAIPTARIKVAGGQHGPGGSPVTVEVSGDDLDAIQRTGGQILRIVKEVEGTAEVGKSWQEGRPEMRATPRRKSLSRHKIQFSQVAGDLRAYVEGQVATQFTDRDENYDVLVKLDRQDRLWGEDVERMFIYSPATGNMVPIGQVATVRRELSPSLIERKDRQRLLTISAELTGARGLSEVLKEVRRQIDQRVDVPEGVHVYFGGQAEMMRKNFKELFKAIITAAVLTFLCVAGIIESFGLAVIIIMSIPICFIGVTLAMLLGGVSVNIFSLMAMIILVGMVVNNAIIVVDYAMRQQRAGSTPLVAIKDACGVRFRMIVMANLTTIVALTPLSLGLGFAGEIFRPLAVVEMGGVFAAAFLSLLIIPVVYVMVRKQV